MKRESENCSFLLPRYLALPSISVHPGKLGELLPVEQPDSHPSNLLKQGNTAPGSRSQREGSPEPSPRCRAFPLCPCPVLTLVLPLPGGPPDAQPGKDEGLSSQPPREHCLQQCQLCQGPPLLPLPCYCSSVPYS